MSSAARNWRAYARKYASSNGYDGRNRFPISLKPVRNGCGNAAAISSIGASPRNRYIGFFNEPPPVSSSASSAPSASSRRATSRLWSSQMPPGNASAMLSLAMTAMSGPTASRTARTTWRGNAARFATLPPHRSVRLFRPGLRNTLKQVVVAEMQLDGVEAGVAQHQRRPRKSFVIRAMSSSVTAFVNFIAIGLNIRDGASPVAPVPAATGPAWPSWADAAAPSACTASTNFASPGSASWFTTISAGAPRPSSDTAV